MRFACVLPSVRGLKTSAPASSTPLRQALHSARVNLVPGLILQAFALTLVLTYYGYPPAREALAGLVELRRQWGFFLPMCTTALFGGVIPFIYLYARRMQTPWVGAGLTLFWFYKGFEIEVLYLLLARFVGEGVGAGTIVVKVFIDQFIYTPFYAVPATWFIYTLINRGGNARSVWRDFRTPGWYYRNVFSILISTWGIWVPTAALIYALPTPLQLPMQNLVLCFFTLLIATLCRPVAPAGDGLTTTAPTGSDPAVAGPLA